MWCAVGFDFGAQSLVHVHVFPTLAMLMLRCSRVEFGIGECVCVKVSL
jgi:hypothetical protein